MRIAVFGANGATGKEIVGRAVAAGHEVTAAVRRPESMEGSEGVRVAKIDLQDGVTLDAAMAQCDVVVSALGHGGVKDAARPTTLYSDSARAFRKAMHRTAVPRIIVLSSGGVVQDDAAPWYYTKLLRRLLMNTYVDMARMETILEETSSLEWTAVRLTYLLKGPSRELRVEEGRLGGGDFKIHYGDAAQFVVDELGARQWINRHPVLGYPR